MRLSNYGWNAYWAASAETLGFERQRLGRVAAVHRNACELETELGRFPAKWTPRLESPAIGDWAVWSFVSPTERWVTLSELLPRKSEMVRKAVGPSGAQVLATNVDRVLIATSMNEEFNPSRLERYLAMAWQSGAAPVLVLTKGDLCTDPQAYLTRAESLAPGVDIHAVSARDGVGVDALEPYLVSGVTSALVGSSGVGKSTLVNRLLGREVQKTNEVRADDQRGRHTTTNRSMFSLPQGGVLIDTPGLRELGLWAEASVLGTVFGEIDDLSEACRFRDCSHGDEPGCAVRRALETGVLETRRLESYRKLQKELDSLAARTDPSARQRQKQQMKSLSKLVRREQRRKNRY